MGVPSFFRWLLEKYPRVIRDVTEEHIKFDEHFKRILPDTSTANPNDIEFDNLYLDMNGIIHPACHPEGKEQPKNEDEMIKNIFEYVDHIFSIVRPRKVLFMAIDGVAPRAKMNQQRARRFRAAQERTESMELRTKLEILYKKKGKEPPPKPKPSWDHNVITPGTPFMDKLAQALRYWISIKLHNDPGWKNIKVILSDANVPGEGEHKIANFIRRIRMEKGYDNNTHHCLHGLDADLFMLGLATHEPRFTILREEVLFGRNKPCENCGQKGHFKDKCNNEPKKPDKHGSTQKFVFAHLWVLREYLEYELKVNLPWGDWSLERVIDDFVFLCFFCGNDFLPHLPSLDIREGALDMLIKEYKTNLPNIGGYLTENNGNVNLGRVSVLLNKLGQIEDVIFVSRIKKEENDTKRREDKKKFERQLLFKKKKGNKGGLLGKRNNRDDLHDLYPPSKKKKLSNGNTQDIYDENSDDGNIKDEDLFDDDQMDFLNEFNDIEFKMDDHFMEMDFEHQLKRIKRAKNDVRNIKNNDDDTVKLGSEGWKEKYYRQKYHINYNEKPELLKKICYEYIRGLCWVMLYYYQGCPSWEWFYPFHYSPFASDLNNISSYQIRFNKGKPFTPFGQLMGVLPAVSGKIALPKEYSDLMDDPLSSIIDFYPTDFKLDLNGKIYVWQAVVVLPFIDETRLTKAIQPLNSKLTGQHKRMNGIGNTLVYVNTQHKMAQTMIKVQKNQNNDKVSVDPISSQGMNGFVGYHNGGVFPNTKLEPPNTVNGLDTIDKGVNSISCLYFLPKYREHIALLLDNVTEMKRILSQTDLDHMEFGDRFGKPRKKRRRDTHFNYNRGWDWGQGFRGGAYKAKKNARAIKNRDGYMPDYQPTRLDYETEIKRDQDRINSKHKKNYDNNNNSNNREYKPNTNFPKYHPYPTNSDHDPYKWVPPNATVPKVNINDRNDHRYDRPRRDYRNNHYDRRYDRHDRGPRHDRMPPPPQYPGHHYPSNNYYHQQPPMHHSYGYPPPPQHYNQHPNMYPNQYNNPYPPQPGYQHHYPSNNAYTPKPPNQHHKPPTNNNNNNNTNNNNKSNKKTPRRRWG